jgi:hypothetical protein
MQRPHVWGRIVITSCTVKKGVIAFGGTLAWLGDQFPSLSTWTLAFGGLDVTLLAHDVTRAWEILEEDLTMCFGTCGHDLRAFGGLALHFLILLTFHMGCPTSP